ncbi:hypothetical protein DV736_g2709, partial [Chaetothyriales sp. CBS 134916]
MTNHHLIVAKATFAASLLRPDVTKIDRSELPHFHFLLETATIRCSSSNIQKCKQWLLDHILSSSQRTSSFARYLTAFAKYAQVPDGQKPCSSQRQHLHILYLLNDLLHHAKYHAADDTMKYDLTQAFQSPLFELVRQASVSAKARVRKRLKSLLSLWEDAGYFEANVIATTHKVINDPSTSIEPEEKSATHAITTREAPYIMPATHGDPSLPFYELPAGNLMLHIIPNKAIAMRPHSIRPLQLTPGPADESLANAVRDFLKDIETIDHEFDLLDDPNVTAEISEMGQVLYRNEAEDLVGDTYFGWSRAFCEKMTARKKPVDLVVYGRAQTAALALKAGSGSDNSPNLTTPPGLQEISTHHHSLLNSDNNPVRITSITPHQQLFRLLIANSKEPYHCLI